MISWNEFLDSLKGEVQDKSKNPFFAAFITTWLIRHWEVIFILFNFDGSHTLDGKLYRINCYLYSLPKNDLLKTIGITFIVILLGYLFLNIARIISNVSEKLITPVIYKFTAGKASIVIKEIYEEAVEREKKVRQKLQEEITAKLDLQNQIERWEISHKNLMDEMDKLKEKFKEDINTGSSDKISSKGKDSEKEEELEPFAKAMVNKFSAGDTIEFMSLIKPIQTGEPILTSDSSVYRYLTLGLIKQKGKQINGLALFTLTELGSEVHKEILRRRSLK
jgi:hypothetical protein